MYVFSFVLDPTGNNHDATELQEVVPDDDGKDIGGDEGESGFKVKERSILQAKLTKLAIQIGYAGIFFVVCLIFIKESSKDVFFIWINIS